MVVCLVRHLRGCGAIVGRIKILGGVMRYGCCGVLKFDEGLIYVAQNRYSKDACVLIPLEINITV